MCIQRLHSKKTYTYTYIYIYTIQNIPLWFSFVFGANHPLDTSASHWALKIGHWRQTCQSTPKLTSFSKKKPKIHRENGGGPLGWGLLKNQPHIHLISRGYLLGISPVKGLLGGLKQLGYHPRVVPFSLWQIHPGKLPAGSPENDLFEKKKSSEASLHFFGKGFWRLISRGVWKEYDQLYQIQDQDDMNQSWIKEYMIFRFFI